MAAVGMLVHKDWQVQQARKVCQGNLDRKDLWVSVFLASLVWTEHKDRKGNVDRAASEGNKESLDNKA